jgi:Collagen triple helix repeat (20 copies)
VPGSRCVRRRWLTLLPLVFLWALAFVSTQSAFAGSSSYWSAPDLVDPAVAPASVSCTSSSFCVAVGYAGADLGSAAVYNGSTWSEASVVDTSDGLSSVSCISSSFCMAMDGSGRALIYNGSTWSAPTPTGTDLTKVSCVSSSFCVAVGGSSQASVYSGGTWSALSSIELSAASISCASVSFCVAVGSSNGGPGYAVTYDGSSWGTPTEIASGYDNPGPTSVSCGSPTFCVAAGGNDGAEETYSDGTWSSPTPISRYGPVAAVSCASESFCVAVAGEEVMTYDGSKWITSYPPGAQLTDGNASISCPTESFCAASSFSSTLVYGDGTWSTPVKLGSGGLSGVSCVSSTLCTVVDQHGRALTYDGSTWSAPSQIDAEGDLASLSCPSVSFCAAVGGSSHGSALTYDGSIWSAPREIDSNGTMQSISCVSSRFCVALSQHGRESAASTYAVVYDGVAWSAPMEVDPKTVMSSVSCVSESFCVAVGGQEAAIYDGISWVAPAKVYAEANLKAVSCPSSSFCVAVAEHHIPAWSEAYAFTYDDGVWSAPTAIPRAPDGGGFDVGSISCPSSSFCAAGALFEGAGAIYEGGSWAPWTELVSNTSTSVSCPSASFCAAVDGAGQVFTYASTTPHFPLAVFITGEGEITSTPAGITCSAAECTYEPEGEVTLTVAKAGAGYEFAGWSGCDRVSGTDCMVTDASKVTALFLKVVKGLSGDEGPAGKEGVTGNEGKSGATGPAGVAGAMGIEGPPGAQGPAGKIELVMCETVKGKQHCTTKLVSGTAKFTTAGSFAQATLSRRGVVYAAGSARLAHARMSLWLSPVRSLRPGKYTLTLISGTGRHKRTSIRSFILR